jgi:hypothetical protein
MRQTNTQSSTSRGKKKPPVDQDPAPTDMDEFRNALARRIHCIISNSQGLWRNCKEPSCRRQRACFAPRGQCSNAPPLPPQTEQDHARTSAMIQRAMRQAMEMQKGEEE